MEFGGGQQLHPSAVPGAQEPSTRRGGGVVRGKELHCWLGLMDCLVCWHGHGVGWAWVGVGVGGAGGGCWPGLVWPVVPVVVAVVAAVAVIVARLLLLLLLLFVVRFLWFCLLLSLLLA